MSLPVVICGAGPAGLTAAHQLAKGGVQPVMFEKDGQVGGISRTAQYKGYRFDIGGHRFFTKVPEVEVLWHEVMGDEFLRVQRLSRIYYDGKFYQYPLSLLNTLANLGPMQSVRIMLSYLKAQVRPHPEEDNFKQWVSNRFGLRLFDMFFRTYTEKVWGIPSKEIRADWAAQRIKSLSLTKAIGKAFSGRSDETSLIDEFWYPPLGPGMMWERFAERVETLGGSVHLNTEVVRLVHDGGKIGHVEVRGDEVWEVPVRSVVSSMPVTHLLERLDPTPSPEVLEAVHGLRYRDFIVVALVLDKAHIFPDNWIYIHSGDVQVGRIQNFKNWSAAMVPDSGTTCLGLEYFCNQGDALWMEDDAALIELATRELRQTGLCGGAQVLDGTVIRQPMAYPVYDATYRSHLDVIRSYLAQFENLQTVGRAGMHRYNNQDHSMLTAMLAVRNILGERHDLWEVNVERSYHESFTVEERQVPASQLASL